MRSLLLVGFLAAGAAQVAFAEQEVRVFQLRFRSARDAAALVDPLISSEGSILLQPKLNAITVRDNAEVLRRVGEALASWDVAPLSYSVRVRVLLASTTQPTPGPASPLISGLGSELQQLFRYTSYQEVDTLHITATDGSSVEAVAGDRYHVQFVLRAVPQDPERVQLSQLEVSRREKGPDNTEVLRHLFRTTMSLKLGQTAILGAARSEAASQGLVLVLWAGREEKP